MKYSDFNMIANDARWAGEKEGMQKGIQQGIQQGYAKAAAENARLRAEIARLKSNR